MGANRSCGDSDRARGRSYRRDGTSFSDPFSATAILGAQPGMEAPMSLIAKLLPPVILALLLATAATPAAAVTEVRGQTASGAYYIVQAPAGWRAGDTLVLWNHGYDIDPPGPGPSLGPVALRQRILAKGQAIAASSYAQRGWALFGSGRDHRELVAAFTARFGAPGRIIAAGGSMGGLVAMQQAEQADLGAPVAGVYALCAPLAGTRVWQQALDLRLAYDAACENVTGGELPRGDEAFPYILKAGDLDDYDEIGGGGELAARIAKCTGVELPSWLVTSGMRERRARIEAATGVDPEFFYENLFYATYGLGDLYRDPAKIGERAALGNRRVVYPEARIERDIRRVDADAFAALDLARHFTPSGQVGTTRVLSTHTSRDGLVVPEHGRALAGLLPAAQWSQAYVVESGPSHCGYSEAELLGGYEQLVDWLGGAAKPDASSLQAACQRERMANPGLGDCRYDPAFAPGPLDAKLKPRNDPAWPVDATASGFWFDPARPGEGFVIESLGSGRVTVTFFTFAVTGSADAQAWFTGSGRVLGHQLIVDRFEGRRGGRFAGPVGSTSVVPFGRFDAVLQACGRGEQRTQAQAPFEGARRTLQRISRVGAARCGVEGAAPATSLFVPWSGAWFEPAQAGRGLFLQVQDDGRAFLAWFAYDGEGRPMWLVGEGAAQGETLLFPALARPVGARFGAAFDPAAVRLEAWGRLRLSGDGCGALRAEWQTTVPGFTSGAVDLARLTTPEGAGCP